MATTSALMTIEEFGQLPDDGKKYELVDGELVELSGNKSGHTRIATHLVGLIYSHLLADPRGQVFMEATCVLSSNPPVIRIPDVAFFTQGRVEGTRRSDFFQGAPDFVAEVVSPSDSASGLNEKVGQYFASGAQVIALIFEDSKQVHAYRSQAQIQILGVEDRLEVPDLLPDLSIRVDELFR